jgi:signal transduction histidine kinase
MGDQCNQAHIAVKWQADPALPVIEGDFAKLFEVFANIFQNAKNAMPDGGTLEVTAKQTRGEGKTPQIAVTIRDTGCGIPAKNLGKIFDPFFTTKPAGAGPGLGLTVSYGIVKKHHGAIEVKSSVGKGTRVSITLPARQPQG